MPFSILGGKFFRSSYALCVCREPSIAVSSHPVDSAIVSAGGGNVHLLFLHAWGTHASNKSLVTLSSMK